MPAAVPELMGGANMLRSVQGVEGVRYIPLAPLSTMAVSVLGGANFACVKVGTSHQRWHRGWHTLYLHSLL